MPNPNQRILIILKQGPVDPEALDRAFAILWRIAAKGDNSAQSTTQLDKPALEATLSLRGIPRTETQD